MQQTQSPYRKHLFVCVNQREGEATCCARGGGLAIRDALKRYVNAHGLDDEIRVSQSGCQGLCEEGPNVAVFPDGCWYRHVQPEDLETIIQTHLAPLVVAAGPQQVVPSPLTGDAAAPHTPPRQDPPVRVLLFDLGNVLLPFDHLRAVRALAPFLSRPRLMDAAPRPSGLRPRLMDAPQGFPSVTAPGLAGHRPLAEVYQAFFESSVQALHDEGRLSGPEFFEQVRQTYGLTLSYEQFVARWNEIFWDDPAMTALVTQLRYSYRLLGISNTNQLHFDYVRQRYPVVQAVGAWILSYEVGVRKPDRTIYERAIAAAGVAPAEIVYVDDRLDLIEAGRALGLRAIPFINAQRLRTRLAQLGVSV